MRKHTIIFLLLIIVLSLLLTGCSSARTKKQAMQAIVGENHEIHGDYDESLSAQCSNGTFVGQRMDSVISFKGIPYAQPPVGKLRWKNPVPAEEDSGVYEAFYFGNSPLQSEWPSEVGSYYQQGEDCLTLNVWSNEAGPKEGKTVMVFFHGGSYAWGATSDPIYDGTNLVEKYPDVVLVTVEYRLGLMGFIDFSEVPGGEAYTTSGNLGLLDQVCALQWVQKNIAAFGSNPDQVTIFGESAGSGSVSLLPLMEGTQGLFRRVIAQSGSLSLTFSRDECKKLTQQLLQESGCSNMEELQALSEEKLRALIKKLCDFSNFPERDGVVLPNDLYSAWEATELSQIDLLIGTNADEVRYWVREMGYYLPGSPGLFLYTHLFPMLYENNLTKLNPEERERTAELLSHQSGPKVWKLTELYNELIFRIPAMEQAVRHGKSGGKSYTYYWTMPGKDQTMGACHAMELSYVFNNPQVDIYTGGVYHQKLADTVQDCWVSFARTGDPSTQTLNWKPYTSEDRQTMVLGEECYLDSDLKREQRELMEPLLSHYFNGCYAQMSLMVPQTGRILAQFLAVVVLIVLLIAALVRLVSNRKRHTSV